MTWILHVAFFILQLEMLLSFHILILESEGRATQRSSLPRKIDFRKKSSSSRQDCFSCPVDSLLDEFDFEKNLALFDKKAVFEEIESNNPDVIRVGDRKPTKYRHDENVLQSKPAVFQQIKVPKEYGVSYVTGKNNNKNYDKNFVQEIVLNITFESD